MPSRFQEAMDNARVALNAFNRTSDVRRDGASPVAFDEAIDALSRARDAGTIAEVVEGIDLALAHLTRVSELQLEATPTGTTEPRVHIVRHITSLCSQHHLWDWGPGHVWVRYGEHEAYVGDLEMCELCLERAAHE